MIELDSNYRYDTELLNDLTQEYIDQFIRNLKNHPNYNELKNNFIIRKEQNQIVHILDRFPEDEVADISMEEFFYYPLCNREEIKRIFNPQTAFDYLLKYRADAIADNPRLHRTFISIRKKHGENWSFSNYIDSTLFERYLQYNEILPLNVDLLEDYTSIYLPTYKGKIGIDRLDF